MRTYLVWGGSTYPQLRYFDASRGISKLYLTEGQGLPQVKLEVMIEETDLVINRLVSREIRRRRSMFLLRCALGLRLPNNREILDFVYEALRLNAPIYIRPHPNCLYWPAPHAHTDEWQVVLDGQFDWRYFLDKWVGHDLTLKLVATAEMLGPPVDESSPDFVPITYIPVEGVPAPTEETAYCFWGERMLAGEYDYQDGVDDVCFWEL